MKVELAYIVYCRGWGMYWIAHVNNNDLLGHMRSKYFDVVLYSFSIEYHSML